MKVSAINRRRFLALAGAGAFATCTAGLMKVARADENSAAPLRPDLIVVNANVYTVDSRLARAEAFALTGGRFQAVGTNQDIRNLAKRGTPVFDAQQMTIVPG